MIKIIKKFSLMSTNQIKKTTNVSINSLQLETLEFFQNFMNHFCNKITNHSLFFTLKYVFTLLNEHPKTLKVLGSGILIRDTIGYFNNSVVHLPL